MTPPQTAAGRALLSSMPNDWHPINDDIMRDHILAIEAEAAAPYRSALAKLVAAVWRTRLDEMNLDGSPCWCVPQEPWPGVYHPPPHLEDCEGLRTALAAARALLPEGYNRGNLATGTEFDGTTMRAEGREPRRLIEEET